MELDFTEHEERELHKMEMDRRMWLSNIFLKKYTWTGRLRKRYREDEEDDEVKTKTTSNSKETEPQSDLEAFVQDA